MNKSLLLLLFIALNFGALPQQLNQGDVIINSFDPSVQKIYYQEFLVLLNNTSSPVDLNGYELRCFDYAGVPVDPLYQWTNTHILQAYGFLLITVNIDSVNEVEADIVIIPSRLRGFIDGDGYMTLRKINAVDSTQYIDIVKYSRYSYPPPDTLYRFTGVPANSGIDSTMPAAIHDSGIFPNPGSYLTRGGVSGILSSLTYTGYGMYGQTNSDFFGVGENSNTYIQNAFSAPLPVELSSFSAIVLSEKEVQLKWRTETEVSNYGFEVQRQSSGNIEWTRIGFVEGNGNSNSPKNYSFIDENLFNASKFRYRLKQIDTDGEFEFSNIIEVDLDAPVKFELSQNYPNPFNPSTTISFEIQKESNVNLSIYNELGELVTTLVNEHLSPGYYQYKFNASNLASGFYLYRVQASDPSSNSGQSFVETKKMILMK